MHPMKNALSTALLAAATLSAGQLTVGTSSNQLNLSLNGAESKVGVKLFDIMGRELFSQQEMTLTSGMHSVPLNSSLARGMYIMQVSVDGKQFSRKMIAGSSATFSIAPKTIYSRVVQPKVMSSGNNITGYSMYDITGNPDVNTNSYWGLGRCVSIGDINGDGNEDLFAIKFGILKMGTSGAAVPDSAMPFGAVYNTDFATYYNLLNRDDNNGGYTYSGEIVDAAYIGKHVAGGVTSDVVVIAVEKRRKPNGPGGLTTAITNDILLLKLSKKGVITGFNYLYMGNFTDKIRGLNKIAMLNSVGDLDKNGYIDFAVVDNSEILTKFPAGTEYPQIDFAAKGRVTLYYMESAGVVNKSVELTAESKNISAVAGFGNSTPLYLNRRCTNVNDLNGDGIVDLMIGQIVFFGDSKGTYTGGYKDMSTSLANIFQKELTAKTSSAFFQVERIDINRDGYIEFVGDTVGKTQGMAFRQKMYTLIPGIKTGGIIEPVLYPMQDLSPANKTYPDIVFSSPINGKCWFGNYPLIVNTDKYGKAYLLAGESPSNENKSTALWSVPLPEYKVPSFTEEAKMLSFSGSQYWSTMYSDVTTRTYSNGFTPGDKNLDIKFTSGTYQRMVSSIPYTALVGSTAPRIRMEIGVRVPEDPAHPELLPYRGNFQLMMNGRWVGQFDINSTVGIGNAQKKDGWYYLHYSMLLPDAVAADIKANPALLEISISAVKMDEHFVFEWINFQADEVIESNRDVTKYIDAGSLDDVPEWNGYTSWGNAAVVPANPEVGGAVQAVKVMNQSLSKYSYYIIRQDVDYPMAFIEAWSSNYGYMPGNTYGPWRQCWMFVGNR